MKGLFRRFSKFRYSDISLFAIFTHKNTYCEQLFQSVVKRDKFMGKLFMGQLLGQSLLASKSINETVFQR